MITSESLNELFFDFKGDDVVINFSRPSNPHLAAVIKRGEGNMFVTDACYITLDR